MKSAEAIGMFVGSIIGAILTGVFVYYTKSIFSVCFVVLFFFMGKKIGSKISLL